MAKHERILAKEQEWREAIERQASSGLKLRKAESQPAYCYRPVEVTMMLNYCRSNAALHLLANVIVALATTGLRISELISLRWSDVDLESRR